MSIAFQSIKSLGDVLLSHLREYENIWVPSEEIDTKEKSADYNEKMEKLSKEINVVKDRFEAEYRIQSIYNLDRQADSLESIAASLKILVEKSNAF